MLLFPTSPPRNRAVSPPNEGWLGGLTARSLKGRLGGLTARSLKGRLGGHSNFFCVSSCCKVSLQFRKHFCRKTCILLEFLNPIPIPNAQPHSPFPLPIPSAHPQSLMPIRIPNAHEYGIYKEYTRHIHTVDIYDQKHRRRLRRRPNWVCVSDHKYLWICLVYSLYIPYIFHIYFLAMFHIFSLVCFLIYGVKRRQVHIAKPRFYSYFQILHLLYCY